MDQDRFTQMAGDLGGHDTAKICKSSWRLYREAAMHRGELSKVAALFPLTLRVENRPY